MEELTLENSFKVRQFNDAADMLSHDAAIALVKELYRSNLVQGQLYTSMIAHEWGISSVPNLGE